jgi:hypothetical protein
VDTASIVFFFSGSLQPADLAVEDSAAFPLPTGLPLFVMLLVSGMDVNMNGNKVSKANGG